MINRVCTKKTLFSVNSSQFSVIFWMNELRLYSEFEKKLTQVHRCNSHSSILVNIVSFNTQCFGSITQTLPWNEILLPVTGCEWVAITIHISPLFFSYYCWKKIWIIRFSYNFAVFQVIKLYKMLPRQLLLLLFIENLIK